ncbi:MAG: outer membrane protein [Gammaproteobacteria bacterium]
MKKLGICGMLLALAASQAFADRGNFYVEGKFGGSHGQAEGFTSTEGITLAPDDFNENVYVWGAAVGYVYKPWAVPLRMEVEYLYRNRYPFSTTLSDPSMGGFGPDFATTQQHTNTQTILANFYLDIPLNRMFAFFVGGGVGEAMSTTYSSITIPYLGDITSQDDNTGFSWMATGGFSVTPVKWLALDLSYRYSGLNSISAKTLTTISTNDFNAQEIFFGIRVMIPDLYPAAQTPRYTPPPVTNSAPKTLDK